MCINNSERPNTAEQMANRDKELYPSIWTPVKINAPIKDEDGIYSCERLSKPEGNMDGQTLITGVKKDEGKPRWELVPFDAIRGVVEILTFGAKKYAARNWERGIAYGRVFGAIMRHLTAWWGGENLDPESGKSHLDHAMCELMFLSAYEKRGMTSLDDRPATIELEVKSNS